MSKKIIPVIVLVFFLFAVALACGLSFDEGSKGADAETEELRLQLTRQSLQMTQSAMSASQSQGQTGAGGQVQQSSSSSSSEDQTKQQSSSSSSSKDDDDDTPCNDSHILWETVKDGTDFDPGETFEKTWTLENQGDCDWTTDYELRFIEGTRMGGTSTIKVPSVIEPGEEITFKVNLTAPDDPGTYTGVWQLFADDGEAMGRYWVQITVGGGGPAPGGPFAVTSVALSTAATPIDLVCPGNVTISAQIFASGPGTVTYKWEDCEGGTQSGSVTFDAAGSKTVTHSVPITFSDPGHWARIYIDNPNHQWFGPKQFEVICNP